MEYQGKAMRQELKFAINNRDYAILRSRLSALIKVDVNAGPTREYHIRSLYFDNDADDAYYEKEDGIFQRGKYRIRIYNHSDARIHLEYKEKFGQMTAKSSRAITRAMYQDILQNQLRFTSVKDDPFLSAFYLKTRLENLRPKVIVDYVREPYVCAIGNVRITFDKSLQVVIGSLDIFEAERTAVSANHYGSMILEVKYDDLLPRFVSDQLKLSGFQRLAISKYTICRELKNALNWKERVL